jgi:hypothetical protein
MFRPIMLSVIIVSAFALNVFVLNVVTLKFQLKRPVNNRLTCFKRKTMDVISMFSSTGLIRKNFNEDKKDANIEWPNEIKNYFFKPTLTIIES